MLSFKAGFPEYCSPVCIKGFMRARFKLQHQITITSQDTIHVKMYK